VCIDDDLIDISCILPFESNK